MKVFLPIRLDRWNSSIPSILRETCARITDMSFYSFSGPRSEEDRLMSESLWAYSHLHRVGVLRALGTSFDVVHHASSTYQNLIATLLVRLRTAGGCAHLFSGQIEPFEEDLWYRHYRLSVQMADRVTAVSMAVADGIKKHFGRSVDAVIPNGVDLEFFSAKSANGVDLKSLGVREPFVIFVGMLEARKRPDIFIALSELLPELDFIMLGGYLKAQERDSYLKLIRKCPNVKYLGLQPRGCLRDLFGKATALVFPSEIEGLALTVVEAQSMGLPVLAQPATCMPEIIQEGVSGWLLPSEPLEMWARKLREILAWSSSERTAYAEGSRAVTKKRFSWDVIAPQYREMYLATQRR